MTDSVQVDPVKCLHIKTVMTSSRRNRYQKTRKVVCGLPDASGTRICSETARNRPV